MTRRPARRRPRRYLAGFLSAIVPGIGQLYAGRPGIALVFLLPAIVLVAIVALAVLSSPARALATVIDPTVLLILLVLQGLILLWRLLAVGSAVSDPRMPRLRSRDALPMLLLGLFVVVPQLLLAYSTLLVRGASEQIFAAEVFRPGRQPIAPPPDWQRERINVLLLGIDSSETRTHALADTIIVASADPSGRTVSMLSVPRDLVDVPLPGGGVYHPKINSLISAAERRPDDFPYARGDGIRALAGAVGELLGVPIHYYARVNLDGFVRVVDTLGGVDVRVQRSLHAPDYGGYGIRGFSVEPGLHHFDGAEALAYARIRKAARENDFTRADRQQQVLVAIRNRVVQGGFLSNVGGFIDAVGDTLETDVPPDRLPFLVGLMEDVGSDRVYRAVIEPPLVRDAQDDRGAILIPDVASIRELAARLFTPVGEEPELPSAPPA